MTEKLYYTDAYMKNFRARVLSCEEKDGVWHTVLDRSAFYPGGGGQPSISLRICSRVGWGYRFSSAMPERSIPGVQ